VVATLKETDFLPVGIMKAAPNICLSFACTC